MSEQNSTVGPSGEECGSLSSGADVDRVETPAPKKKKTSTLRRAFSWLRGRRKKKKEADVTKAKKQEEKAKAKAKHKAAIKAEESKRQGGQHKSGDRQQENVFFPSSRPPELEELHIQAQEGLKSKQHQDKHKHHKNDRDETDTNSIVSSPVVLAAADDDNVAFRTRSLSCAAENASEDSLSIRSEMIQRTGSTFRPHDTSKKSSERSGKKRKERRTTVVGIPQHIQKELGVHNHRVSRRGALEVFQRQDALQASQKEGDPQLPQVQNGVELGKDVVFIPTVDGSITPLSTAEGGVRVSLQALEGGQTQEEIEADEAFQRHMHKVYYDDTNIGKKSSGKISPQLRPKSLAVPGMTTHGGQNDLMGPVMSISPQGTYMSKIIPNAILPPMVDVIALTSNSVRTLSRCSLATASPASVRSSLRHYHSRQHSSSSENWSHSQSTETIVSNTSTISSRGGSTSTLPNEKGELNRESNSHTPVGDGKSPRPSDDQLSLGSSIGLKMNGSVVPSSPNFLTVVHPSGRSSPAFSIGSAADASDTMSIASDRSSVRNVSLRKSKKPPAPPRRTYSLQQQREMGLPPKPERRPPAKVSGSSGAKDPWVKRLGNRSPGGEDEVFTTSLSGEPVTAWSESPAYSSDPPAVSQISRSPASTSPSPGKKEILPELQPIASDISEMKQNSPERFERTTSPSSGYSSQSGTPTLSMKGLLGYSSSPRLRRPQVIKQERVESVQSNAISISSSSTSLSSVTSDSNRHEAAASTSSVSASDTMSQEFVIPPHPKVSAPLFPPPSKPKIIVPALSFPTPDQTVITVEDKMSGDVKTGHSAPPSPPPSYHPPPPPARKSESDSDISPLAPSKDSSWPPPPPPLPDDHELSMADFPPPEEEYFDAPLPPVSSLQLESNALKEDPTLNLPQMGTEPPPTRIPAPITPSFSARVSSRIQQQGGSHVMQRPAPAGESSQPKPAPVPPLLMPGNHFIDKSTVIVHAARAGSAAPSAAAPTSVVEAPLTKNSASAIPSVVPPFPATACTTEALNPPPVPAPPPTSTAVATVTAPSTPLPAATAPAPPPIPAAPALNTLPWNLRSTQSLKKPSPLPVTEAKKNITRSKSIQTPKEDANLPLVTPSLLQMVRLRSVQAGGNPPGEPKTQLENQNGPTGTSAPQKPVRKSLSLRSPPANSDSVPSNPLQQAVQLKASTLSSKGHAKSPSAKTVENPTGTTLEPPTHTVSTSESNEMKDGQTSPLRKSPANTASFIFAKSPKKVVIDPVSSPEAQAGLQKNLVAELMSYSLPRNPDTVQQGQLLNGKPVLQRKPSKIPPPVARKPSQSTPRSPTSPQGWASCPRSPLGPQPWTQPRSPARVQAPGGGGSSTVSAPQDIKTSSVSKDEVHTVSSEPKEPTSEGGSAVQLAGQDPQPQKETGSSAP
ncbi:NHS-like protein 3 [Lissotriton helveticus]